MHYTQCNDNDFFRIKRKHLSKIKLLSYLDPALFNSIFENSFEFHSKTSEYISGSAVSKTILFTFFVWEEPKVKDVDKLFLVDLSIEARNFLWKKKKLKLP